MIMKTELSTIIAALAIIAIIAIMGTIGGIGQQQTALALELDLERLLDDEIELDDEIDEELEDPIPPEAAEALRRAAFLSQAATN
jgi:hypothetical protein